MKSGAVFKNPMMVMVSVCLLVFLQGCASHEPNQVKTNQPVKLQVKPTSAEEMYKLARRYHYAMGEQKDLGQALYWYERSAHLGYAAAQYQLALFNDNGIAVPKNIARATYWYRQAAMQGISSAQINLGWLYLLGEDITQSNEEALYWFHQAAKQRDGEAMVILGSLYRYGQAGLKRDGKQAVFWYAEAVKEDRGVAMFLLGDMCQKGDLVPKDLQMAKEWYQQAADQGYRPAIERLKELQ